MKLRTLLVLISIAVLITGCALFDNSPPEDEMGNSEPPQETPSPPAESTLQTDIVEGEVCIFERSLPREIHLNEPFAVTVGVKAKEFVQSAFLSEDGWFREFRKDVEPIHLWQSIPVGEKLYYSYEVTMWSSQAQTHPYMTGSLSCNTGGLGLSEELDLRSDLNLVLNN